MTEARAEYLRAIYREHVHHPATPKNPAGHWKGRAEAIVPNNLADDLAEAMAFVGSIVDFRGTDGTLWLARVTGRTASSR